MRKFTVSLIAVCIIFCLQIDTGWFVHGEQSTAHSYGQNYTIPKPPTSRILPFRQVIGSNDEGSHDRENSTHQEWWYFIAFFNSNDSELKNWSMMVSFNQMALIDILFCAVFEDGTNRSYGGTSTTWTGTLTAAKSGVNVSFLNSTVKGRYPRWVIDARYNESQDDAVVVNVTYTAQSLPLWLFMNLGYNRSRSHLGHYCIITSDVQGTVTINKTTYMVHGVGYHEHSWGNVKQKPPASLCSFTERQQAIRGDIPLWQVLLDAWDWTSIFLENGWNIFVAKICQQSPISRVFPGSLWVTPDGENITECRYFDFEYLETINTSIPTIQIPTKIHINAFFVRVFLRNPSEGLVRLDLTIEVVNRGEYTWHDPEVSFGVWECPCTVEGTLSWGIHHVKLQGHAMLEITRAAMAPPS